MSNQVYENNQSRYIVSKLYSGYYLSASFDITNTTGEDTIIPWSNTSGSVSSLPFTVNDGVLTCVREGIYYVTLTVSVNDNNNNGRVCTSKVLMYQRNQQFNTPPGFEVAFTINQGGLSTESNGNTVVTQSAIIYATAADTLECFVGNYGSPSNATDVLVVLGDANGLNTNIHFLQIA